MTLIDPLVRAEVQVAGSDAPEKTELKVGFIPLTGYASVVMVSTLDLDKKYDIKITLSKEALWAGVHGKLVSGDLDAAHVLYGLVYGAQLGIGGPKKGMAVLMTPNNNGQAITLSPRLKEAGIKDKASLKATITKGKREYVFAQAFPTGTYAMWLYYRLTAHNIHPLQDAKTITVPPSQMITSIRVDNMDGYCVDEPWDARAITNNIDFTAGTTRAIWKDHPEKMLGTTTEFVQKYSSTMRTLTTAVLEASKLIDASAPNRRKTAGTIAAKSYINIGMDIILDRMLGRYTNSLGRTWDDPDPVRFYHDDAINFPYLSDGMRFLMQHKRQGLLKVHPDYLAVAKQVNRVNILKQAAAATDTPLPKNDMRMAKLIDGVVWDAKDPAAYVDGFKLKA